MNKNITVLLIVVVAVGAYFLFVNTQVTAPLPIETKTVSLSSDYVGMTIAEAEMHAKSKEVGFRTGSIDGESTMLTSDFRPGRMTASTEKGFVVRYTIE